MQTTRSPRLSAYASAARMTPVVPLAMSSMMLVTEANADVYSQTGLSLTIGFGGPGSTQYLTITGAGSASVGQINFRTVNSSYAAITGNGIEWRGLTQRRNGGNSNWFGGIPVSAGATWNNLGRTTGEFTGTDVSFNSSALFGDINFGSSNVGGFNDDPQGVGDNGDTWYLLFRFTSGSGSGDYGWLSFTANVDGTSNSYITITGWGYDDAGGTIAAGATASPVPGLGGLAALAIGAGGVRRKRQRVA